MKRLALQGVLERLTEAAEALVRGDLTRTAAGPRAQSAP